MNILKTVTISVTSVYEHEYTFGRLIASAIARKLTEYGFAYTNPSTNTYCIFWNDQPVVVIAGSDSTTKCSLRVAGRYGTELSNSFGSSYTFGSIKSTSTAEQTVSLDVAFFTTAVGAYIVFGSSCNVIGCTCVSLDGTEVALHIKNSSSGSTIVLDKEPIGNESTVSWSWTYNSLGVGCAEPARCLVYPRAGLVRNKLVEYTLDHVILVESSATYTAGRVVTIDGEKYVYCRDKLFMRMN